MTLRSFIYGLLVVLSSTAHANQVQDIERLQEAVLKFAQGHYRDAFGKAYFDENVKIQVGRIDSRLRLAACDDNLTFSLQEPPHNVKNITVKTSCKSDRRWTVYVPATVEIYADVLVSNRSLQRGDQVQREDFSYRRMDVSSAGRGHVLDFERIEGMEVHRPIQNGEVVRLNYLKPTEIVAKGQTVVVTSTSRFLSVETSGVALSSGHMGEQIKVRNERSNRVVSAEVIAPGKVIVADR